MEKKFKETTIPEDYSKAVELKGFSLGTANTYRIATVLFDAVSSYFIANKSKTSAKALVFRSENNEFLAGAKVEYIGNDDDPTNPSAGHWNYIWTFNEEDLEGADKIEVASNSIVASYFTSSGLAKYNMKFAGVDVCIMLMVLMLEIIKKYLEENSSEGNDCVLTLDQVFTAKGTVEDGKIELAIMPEGDMKRIVKNDAGIQEN